MTRDERASCIVDLIVDIAVLVAKGADPDSEKFRTDFRDRLAHELAALADGEHP